MTTATAPSTYLHHLTIRPLDDADLDQVRQLAQRDDTPMPAMPILGAVSDGRLVAALALSDSDGANVIADPFVASGGAAELLRLRASQLHDGGARPRGRVAIGVRTLLGRLRPAPSRASAAVGP